MWDKAITEVDNLQGLYPLKDEWIISCSLETWLVDQMKSSTTEVEMVKRLMDSRMNQRLAEQTQEMDFKL